MKVLVICDDLWHPAEVIEKGLAAWGDPRFQFDIVKAAKDILTPERIAGYPVILCCKGDSVTSANNAPWFEDGVTEVRPAEFEEYVRAGGGFVSLHASNTARAGSPMAAFVGNSFVGHPPRCGVEMEVTGEHPVTAGVEPFHIRDEHYELALCAPDAEVFLHSQSSTGGRQVAGYSRQMGEGRLCVLTPGHTLDVWLHPQFLRLLGNALAWCARA